jgi:hypothetical protein
MRYLRALGSTPAAVQFAQDLRAAFAAAGHREAGPPVLLSHHLALGEAVVALRQAQPQARIVVLLGTPDEGARALASEAAHGAAVFNLLAGAVRPQDVLASLEGPRRTYQDVRELIEAPTAPPPEVAGGGPVVTVLGSGRRCGAATVAANLCFLLAGAGHAVEALDLRDYPRLAMLLHADAPPGGGRRQVGLREVGVTEIAEGEDPAALIAATAARAAWTLCLPPPDPRDPRTAAALVAALVVWLVVAAEPWVVQTAATWRAEGRVPDPAVLLNRHLQGLAIGPAFVQARLGRPCAAVLADDPGVYWEAQRRSTVAAELDPRPWRAVASLLPKQVGDPVGDLAPKGARLRTLGRRFGGRLRVATRTGEGGRHARARPRVP